LQEAHSRTQMQLRYVKALRGWAICFWSERSEPTSKLYLQCYSLLLSC
jgi:hypothetical protein